jgi:two-component sensor histidine kinase
MEIIPGDGKCIVNADGTIIWADPVFIDWFSHRASVPGIKFTQLFPGVYDFCKPGSIFEDVDKLGRKRYFEAECTPSLNASGEKICDEVRLRNVTLMKALIEISKISTQTRTPKDYFDRVLWLIKDTFAYLAVAGFVVRNGNVELIASKGWTEKLKSMISIQAIAPDSVGMAGRAAYQRTQMVTTIEDYDFLPNSRTAIERMGGEFLVVTPLMDQDRMVGVLTVIHSRTLTPEHFEALQAICNQIAVGLNVRLREEELILKADDAMLYVDLIAHATHDNDELIKACVEPLSGEEVTGKQAKSALQAIEWNENAVSLVRALSRGESQEKLSLGDIVRDVIPAAEAFAGASDKKLNVKHAGVDRLQVSPLFRYAIHEALVNSIVHAGAADVDVDIKVTKDRSGVNRIEISDNGSGIPDEIKSEVFRLQKSQRVKNPHSMGLYLIKKIANKFGGRVWIEDRVPGNYSKGARIVITLPQSA